MDFPSRLAHALDLTGMTREAIIEALKERGTPGASYPSLRTYLRDEEPVEPSLEFIRAVADLAKVRVEWLAFESGPKRLPERDEAAPDETPARARRHPLAWTFGHVVERMHEVCEEMGWSSTAEAATVLSRTMDCSVDHETGETLPHWPESDVTAFLEGETEPPLTFVMDFAVRCSVSAGWLVAGEGSPHDRRSGGESADHVFRAEIPFYDDVERASREVLKAAVPRLAYLARAEGEPIPTVEFQEVARAIAASVMSDLEHLRFNWRRIGSGTLSAYLRARGEALNQLGRPVAGVEFVPRYRGPDPDDDE